jgi:transcriptional regulator with XRE-family HTH domain
MATNQGPELLRRLRLSARMTQEQLANLSGVHVRTVRGLETGRISAPRRATVNFLIRALGLDASAQMRVLESWGLGADGPVGAEVPPIGEATPNDIEQFLAHSWARVMSVQVSETVTVGADRRPRSRQTQEVAVALTDGVTGRHLFYDPEDSAIDMSRFDLTGCVNCQVVRERVTADGSAKLIELSYGRSLRKGETHVVRYSVDLAAALAEESSEAPAEGTEIGGFSRSPAVYVLEVRFDSKAIPRHCSRIFQARPQGAVQRMARLKIDNNYTAHIALINPKPGGHGICWRW